MSEILNKSFHKNVPLLNYKFREKKDSDYIISSSIHPNNNNLENIVIHTKHGQQQLYSKLSPTTYKIKSTTKILDQGNIGSCVANSFAYCISIQTKNTFELSRLHLYALTRILDNTPLNQDDGTTIQTACDVIKKYGSCKEQLYPYITNNFSLYPPMEVLNSSKRFKKFTYLFLTQDITTIKNCLSNKNIPIICGIMIYDSFMTDSVSTTGIVPLPNKTSEQLLGSHCITIIGYDDNKKVVHCVNSWGISWGNNGCFTLPYDYILDPELADDLCCTTFLY